MKIFEILLLMFLFLQATNSSVSSSNTEVVCVREEREALLTFKKGLHDPTNWLLSWAGEDCCTWKGVSCSNRTGHVIKLDLGQPYHDISSEKFDAYMNSLLGGEISSSLLDLKHLKYLDLSMKRFYGVRIPEFLGSFKNLRYLNISNAGFSGMVPQKLGNLSSLQYLDLNTNSFLSAYSDTGLYVKSMQWLSHLSFLQYLDMSGVNLNYSTDYLQVLNMLPSLTNLFLSNCKLNPIPDLPASVVNFTSLKIIDLSENQINSSAPDWLFSIRSLSSIQLSGNVFHGSIPGGLRNITSLRVLNLAENSFDSTIPEWLYNMSSLVTLDISDNNLGGSIMSAVGNLTSLTRLNLKGNEFKGEIPATLGNLCNLQELYLSGSIFDRNSFSGPIPPSMGRLTSLRKLYLLGNQLNGSIPESFGHLSQLEELIISHNSLEGEVSEVHFTNLTRLKIFYASSNSLVLKVSSNWTPPFQLMDIYLRSWHLGRQFPAWLQTQRNISSLDLSDTGISGQIPTWFWNLSSQISYLNLSYNWIHGELPRRLKLDAYSMIFLGSNRLEGPIPHFSSSASLIDLSNNFFSGSISHFLCQEINGPSNLRVLDLSDNLLSKEIPDCWRNWNSLEVINLGNNNFTGYFPSSLGSLFRLQSLHVRNNCLSGELPSSLQNCTELQIIDLDKNGFSGHIPMWFGEWLVKLIVLVVHSNNFGGSIPAELCNLSSLQILDFGHNNFTGNIPDCFSKFSAMAIEQDSGAATSISEPSYEGVLLPYHELLDFGGKVEEIWLNIKGNEFEFSKTLNLLMSMDLSDNHLSGEIPKELTRLLGLQSLNLSRNNLTGNIPEKIGDMKLLESLDLSNNKLSGGIPHSISNLTFLDVLNLSYNHLSGTIPLSTQLQSFDASSFAGNLELCGPPLTPNCSKVEHQRTDEGSIFQMEEFYVSMVLGLVVGFWFVWGPLLFMKSWRLAYFRFLTNMIDNILG